MCNPFVEAARGYQTLGLHVIPVQPRGKRPLVEWKAYQEDPPHPDEIEAWWAKTPDANVGLVLGRGTFAVDLDGGLEALNLLLARGISLPLAPTSRTANGLHVFLASSGSVPDRVALLRAPDGIKAQVDVRGVGIVVVPPSIHTTGKQYEWEIPLALPLPPAPAELLELIRTGRTPETKAASGGDWVAEALRGVPEGQRDHTCTQLAGFFLHTGLDKATVEALLVESFARNCTPPLDVATVRKCVQSIARREAAKPLEQALPILEGPVTILRRLQDRPDPIPTGIPELDVRLRGGMRPGKALVIGGTAGAGKTALGLQIARAAAEAGCAVACFMADEGREPAIIRLGQQLGYIREQIEEGFDAVLAAMERDLAGKILTFPDPDAEADTTIEGVTEALVQAYPGQSKLLFLDSIQTVHTRHPLRETPTLRERIMENARTARRLAVEHGLAVVYTSEVNRSWYRSRKEEDRASDLAAFAEARIEFSGDVLLTMRGMDEDPDLVDVRIPKNRLGTRLPMLLRLDRERALLVAVDGDPREAMQEQAQSRKVEEATAGILRELTENPGLTRGQLKDLVHVKAAVFCEAIKSLRASGIIHVKTEGRAVRHYRTEALE